MYTPTHQLHELAIYACSRGCNERWQLMSKLVQFTSVHFGDLNLNPYDNLKKHEVWFKYLYQDISNLVEVTTAFSLKIRVNTCFF